MGIEILTNTRPKRAEEVGNYLQTKTSNGMIVISPQLAGRLNLGAKDYLIVARKDGKTIIVGKGFDNGTTRLGAKLAYGTGKASGNLTASGANAWNVLGGNPEESLLYKVLGLDENDGGTSFEEEVKGEKITFYPVELIGKKAKQVRGEAARDAKSEATATEASNA